MPKVISNYYEPFLGSGSVLFYVLQQQLNGNVTIRNNIVVSDFNGDLINFFKKLQQTPMGLYVIFDN
jgi:site-specific DNA-adenine methylase